MELRQLKYFLAVADARSFVKAAKELYVSRQAVSKSIALLESELQVELFMRDSSGAYLTPAGVHFYERARSSVLELGELQEEIRQYSSQFRQVIRVAFSLGTLQLFEPGLQAFLKSQDQIVVKYQECAPGDWERLLREHKADVVITSNIQSDPLYDAQELFSSPYGVLLREQEELGNLDALEASDLSWLPLGCFSDGQTDALCTDLSVKPQYTGLDLVRLYQLTIHGQCALVLPKCLAPTKTPSLHWVPLESQQQWTVHRVYLRSSEKNTLLHSAIDEFLHQVFGISPE